MNRPTDVEFEAYLNSDEFARRVAANTAVIRRVSEFLDMCEKLGCGNVRCSSGYKALADGGGLLPHTITISHEDLNRLTRALKKANKKATTTATTS